MKNIKEMAMTLKVGRPSGLQRPTDLLRGLSLNSRALRKRRGCGQLLASLYILMKNDAIGFPKVRLEGHGQGHMTIVNL